MDKIYKKENLSFDEIVVLMENNYDPDKKLMLLLLKDIANKPYNIYKSFLFYDLITKNIDKYDLTKNSEYLDLAFKLNIYELIELFIKNKAKVSEYSLVETLKCCFLYNINFDISTCDFPSCKLNDNYSSFFYWAENKTDLNAIFLGACLIANKPLIDLTISKGCNDWNTALTCACYSGNKEIVDFIISKGGRNYNLGLEAACRGGHRELVDYMISIGAYEFENGLYNACRGGHRELVDYLSKKTNDCVRALEGACRGGHRELVDHLISKYSYTVFYRCNKQHWNWWLKDACTSGNMELIIFIESLIKTRINENGCNYDEALEGAYKGGNIEVIKYILSKGANINKNIKVISEYGHRHLIDYLESKNVKYEEKDKCIKNYKFRVLFELTIKYGNKFIF